MSLSALAQGPKAGEKNQATVTHLSEEKALTQIAILLDTSGSMNGLIDQARCQLWNAVTELATASQGGQTTKLEIAVYQYGSNQIPETQGFLRQVTGFTEDLDEVSRSLFSLHPSGRHEFCGAVIDHALSELDWSTSPNAYQAIFIAGNESFDQGNVTFGKGLPKALSKSVVINSIYCDNNDKFVANKPQWQAAAQLADGMFFNINHNHHLPEMKTPYDSKMRDLNKKMNSTFVWYGPGGQKAATNQKAQDDNARKMSDHAFAARMSTKIGHLYHHAHHDLIDALAHGKVDLTKMRPAQMPENLRAMSPDQRKAFLNGKTVERNQIRRQMADVISKRHSFIQKTMSDQPGIKGQNMTVLGDALVNAVRRQAIAKGFQFGNQRTAKLSNENPLRKN